MKNKFIELTEKNGSKILYNMIHIAWIEPGKEGSVIMFNIANYSFTRKVTESYNQVRSMIETAG